VRFAESSIAADARAPLRTSAAVRSLRRSKGCRQGFRGANMRKALWRIIVVAASLSCMVGVSSADPYKWCAVETSGSTNCSFVTMDQCRATISGNGGSCEPKQILPTNLSPSARNAAPKTSPSGNKGSSLMECVTNSCRINCSPKVAKRFRPKWCVYFMEPI
jgi:hypothetical protein